MSQALRSSPEFRYRTAFSADVPAMVGCRASDREAGPADPRMAAYLSGQHNPQQALAARTAFVALAGNDVVGYIAGHATSRYGCSGEVQYLYVAPHCRRSGVAHHLLGLLAQWFHAAGSHRVCVNADVESRAAVAFYLAEGALPLNTHWYVWEDIEVVSRRDDSGASGFAGPDANELVS